MSILFIIDQVVMALLGEKEMIWFLQHNSESTDLLLILDINH